MSVVFNVGDVIEIVSFPPTHIGCLPPNTKVGDKLTIVCTLSGGWSGFVRPRGMGADCPCGKHGWIIHTKLVDSGFVRLIKKETI